MWTPYFDEGVHRDAGGGRLRKVPSRYRQIDGKYKVSHTRDDVLLRELRSALRGKASRGSRVNPLARLVSVLDGATARLEDVRFATAPSAGPR
jgi:hypothetical protein